VITSDETGFDEFLAARSAALSRTAYLLTGDHHLAQDLVQSALLHAVKHWRRIHTSPEAYVRRAMYHQNISWWRRRRFAESPLGAHDEPVPASDPTLRLTMSRESFIRLAGGRCDAEPGTIAVEGDQGLGQQVLDAMATTP